MIDERKRPLTPDEFTALVASMESAPGLYGDDIHRLMLSYRLLQGAYQISEQARSGHAKLIQKMSTDLSDGNASDGHHTHKELYEYRLLYNAYAALGMYAAGYTVARSWKHHDGEPCFGGGWFVVVMYVPGPDDTEVQVTNHYEAEAWDLFDQIPELPVSLEWDGHNAAEAAQRLRDGVARALPVFQDLKYDAERTEELKRDVDYLLSEFAREHWQECHTTDDGCYLCAGYLELKEKYRDA